MSSRTENTSRVDTGGAHPSAPQKMESRIPSFVDKILPSALDTKLDKTPHRATDTDGAAETGSTGSVEDLAGRGADGKPSR